MFPTRTRFTCPVPGCNRSFSRQSDCTRHENEYHGDLKSCPVDGCNWKKAKRKGRLDAHMRKHHSLQIDVPAGWPSGQASMSNYGASQTSQADYTQNYSEPSTIAAYNSDQSAPAATTYDQIPSYQQPSTGQSNTYAVANYLQVGSGSQSTGGAAAATIYTTADAQGGYSTAGPSNDPQYEDNYKWSQPPA